AAPTEPVSGRVAIGGQSRIILEPDDDGVRVYYLLEIVNAARSPVNPPAPFAFDMPSGAVGTTILEGSSPQASVKDTRVTVQAPFASGRTLVQVACEVPATTGSLDLVQTFPADLDQLAVVVKKV